MGKTRGISVDCLLDLHDTSSELEPNHFDAMVIADWKPENAKSICHGPCIGLDTRGIEADCLVKTDHHKGGELAGRHLRERGRQKVAYWVILWSPPRAFRVWCFAGWDFPKGGSTPGVN